MSGDVTPEAWFARVADALGTTPAPVDAAARTALLDLARVAAHTSERWTAPVTTWLAGLALADLAPAERAERLAALVTALERRAGAADDGRPSGGGASEDGLSPERP